jgi:hypothetical protein
VRADALGADRVDERVVLIDPHGVELLDVRVDETW